MTGHCPGSERKRITGPAWEEIHTGTSGAREGNELHELHGLTNCQLAAGPSSHILQLRTWHTETLSSLSRVTREACGRPVNILWEMQVCAIRARWPFLGPCSGKSNFSWCWEQRWLVGAQLHQLGLWCHSAETRCNWELRRGWDEQGQCRDSNRGGRIESEAQGNKGNKRGKES